MRYFRSYQFAFDNPSWLANLLLGALCQMIPVIGPIVMLGYQFEVVEELHLSRERRYPDFTFDRFVPYVTRGMWPFIVQVCAGMAMGLVIGGLWLVVGLGAVAVAANNPNAAWLVPAAFIGIFGIGFIVLIALSLLLVPLTLWAGLAQEFSPGAMWVFLKDFLRRVLMELILARLFDMVMRAVVIMAAFLMCCLPVFPAAILVMLANSHLVWQLYELYLQRGGTEIPLKIEEAIRAN